MAAKPCDDPMDLGPFLQNYVLRNPFHEFMLGSSQLSDIHPKANDHLVPKMLTMSSTDRSQIAADLTSVPPLVGKLKRIVRPIDDVTTTDGLVKMRCYEKHQRLAMTSSVESNQCLKDLVDTELFDDKEKAIKQELEQINDAKPSKDSSDVLFENQVLGEMKKNLLSKHSNVHQWLLSNFKYLSQFHNCLTSARILLSKVQKTFPDIRKRTFSQLIAFGYPCCPKIVQDGETFYQGLVPKLAEGILENASSNFMLALENVTKGQMSIPNAAEKFEVYEGALKSVLMWDKVDLSAMASDGLEIPMALQPSEFSNCNHSSSQECLKETRVHMSSSRTCNVAKRARLSACCNDCQEESNDDNIDFEKMLQNLNSENVVRKTVFQPSSIADGDRLHSSPADGSQHLSIRAEFPIATEDTELKIKPITSTINVNCIGSAVSCSLAVNDPDCVISEDVQSISNGSNDGHNFSNGVMEFCVPQTASPLTKFDHVTRSRELHCKKSTNSASSDCVTDLELQFQQAKQDLANCRCINVKLQTELDSMQNENLLLKEELNTRDFHLVHLAEDFFKLHSQFKKLAEQFQLILNETQNSLSQNFPNCHCR